MRFTLFLPALAIAALNAPAQERAGPVRAPSLWLSVSGGYLWMSGVSDGPTASRWLFSNGFPLRISVEKTVGSTGTLGLAYQYHRAPLRYLSADCPACSAHATVAMYGPMFRLGSGRSMYQVLEIGAGVVQYGDFTNDASGDALPPTKPDLDFAFSLGLGVAYPVSRRFTFELVFSSIRAVHQRTNLPGNASASQQHSFLRGGIRAGV